MSQPFTRKRALTLPVLSFKERDIAYVRIIEPMHQSDVKDPKKPDQKPATVCNVVDLETGEEHTMIVPVLVEGALEDMADSYVGLCFEIWVSPEVKAGKDYKEAKVYEIDCPNAGPEKG